jgi:hypothetical protein
MTRCGAWLVHQISRFLDGDERDVVRGDLAECRVADARAIWEVLGLVIRRQAALWADWRPWVALTALVAPLGMVLSIASRQWANAAAIYAWLYVNNWTWGYLESPGARLDLLETSANLVFQCLVLICWAWTIGCALGSLSRRTLWFNGFVFAGVLFGGTLDSTTAGLRNPANAAVFSLTFYRVVLPAFVRVALVFVPAVFGMQKGHRAARLPLFQALLWAGAVATLTAFAAGRLETSVVWGWLSTERPVPGLLHLRGTWQLGLVPLAMAWPAAYLLARASWPHWRATSP